MQPSILNGSKAGSQGQLC